jgi:hypothetical protein
VTVLPPTVSVPLRDVLLAGTVKVTEPMPVPVTPAVIVIHGVVVVAVHEHLVPVVTENVELFPPSGTVNEDGATEYVQLLIACVNVTVWPATVMVPIRTAAPSFGATVKVTCPMLIPVAPLVTVIQSTLLTAVQAQPVITETALVMPVEGTLRLLGVTVAVHCASTVRTPATRINATSAEQRWSVIVPPSVRDGPVERVPPAVHNTRRQ